MLSKKKRMRGQGGKMLGQQAPLFGTKRVTLNQQVGGKTKQDVVKK